MGSRLGIGARSGTQLAAIGIETIGGYVVSLEGLGKGMAITASIKRIRPGVGVRAFKDAYQKAGVEMRR